MSGLNITVVEKRGSPFDRLPTELIVNIVSKLPNLKSVLAFGLTSHRNHAIIMEHEGTIARNMAATFLEDDDPEVARLAFLACKATLIEYPNGRIARRAHKFIKQYINPGTRQSHIYQFRTLALMPELSVSVEILLDWTATYATVWPLKSGKRVFTDTEVTRMRRIIYLAEAGIRLLCTIPQTKLGRLADKFWLSFPLWDVDRAYAFMNMIDSDFWSCNEWSVHVAGRGPRDELDFPWHAHDDLRNKLCILHLSMWRNRTRVQETDTFSLLSIPLSSSSDICCCFNRLIDWNRSDWAAKRTWYSGLDRDEIEWLKLMGYFDPAFFTRHRLCDWFFMIADEDRLQRATSHGLIWSWGSECVGRLMNSDGPLTIVWHEDPTPFGCKGTVGTSITIKDVVGSRYVLPN